jgi:hypothetical protein
MKEKDTRRETGSGSNRKDCWTRQHPDKLHAVAKLDSSSVAWGDSLLA